LAEGACGSPRIPDPNEILDSLLSRVEAVIKETSTAAVGIPLFAVEAELTERLRAALPDVRFTAKDIRAWSAQVAS
jgi:hypothetical protein